MELSTNVQYAKLGNTHLALAREAARARCAPLLLQRLAPVVLTAAVIRVTLSMQTLTLTQAAPGWVHGLDLSSLILNISPPSISLEGLLVEDS